ERIEHYISLLPLTPVAIYQDHLQFKLKFFFSSRRRHTRFSRDWSSDVCSSDLPGKDASKENHASHEPKNSTLICERFFLHFRLRSEERRVGKECSTPWWTKP